MAIDVKRALQAFVGLAGQTGGLEQYYTKVDSHLHIAKSVMYVSQTVVGDSFVVRYLSVYICFNSPQFTCCYSDVSSLDRLEVELPRHTIPNHFISEHRK